VNFLAYLGWSPNVNVSDDQMRKESRIKLLPELCEEFKLEGVTKSSTIVDEDYLKWLNKCHFKNKLEDSKSLREMAHELKTVAGKLLQ